MFFSIDKYSYNGVFVINYMSLWSKHIQESTSVLEYCGILGAVPKGWKKHLFQSMGDYMILNFMKLLTY